MSKNILLYGLIALGLFSCAVEDADSVMDHLSHIDIRSLELKGELGRRVDVTIDNNIKTLDLHNNFTGHFALKQGPDIVGGFVAMGMLIDASVRLAAYSQDPGLIQIKEDIVNKVISAQLENGYSGFYKEEKRLWNPDGDLGDNWDIHEMAFIIDGLLSDYQFFGQEKSLEAAKKTADFILEHWHEMPEEYDINVDMHVLDTGIDWAIIRLYRVTGEKRYLQFSEEKKSLYDWDTPIVIGRRQGVSGHMFAYFAMCMAQMELYRITGDPALLQQTEKAIDFFLAQDGLTITGSAGQREIWTNDQDGEGDLGESCASAYQLRVYESLMRLSGKSVFGDLIERTVYNGLFAAQSPDGNQIRYYTPFEGERHYYPFEHMCCPGNFRRIISELPSMVYYRTMEDGIAVNLYAESSVSIKLENGIDVKMEQETDYPNTGLVLLSVDPEESTIFPLNLRIPLWAKERSISVNGVSLNEEIIPGEFLSIERKWKKGDQLRIEFGMDFRFIEGRKRNAGRVALMRGPLIYGLNLSLNKEVSANGEREFNDLRRILLDPETLRGPFTDSTVRPGGTAFEISGWREKYSGKADRRHEFRMRLTEFPDPGMEFIYFKIPDYSIQVADELVMPLKPIANF